MSFCIRKRSKKFRLTFFYSENAPPRRTHRELILSATAAIFIFLK